MAMSTLLEYSNNYSKAPGSFWNYYRNELNSCIGGAVNNINNSIKSSKLFDYKTSTTGKLEDNNKEKQNVLCH